MSERALNDHAAPAASRRLPRGAWAAGLLAVAIGGFVVGQMTGDTAYRQTSVDWTVVGVSPDGQRLTIAYEGGDPSCHADKVEAYEGLAAVQIKVLVRRDVGAECRDIALRRTTEIRLDHPFGALWDAHGTPLVGQDGWKGAVGRGD